MTTCFLQVHLHCMLQLMSSRRFSQLVQVPTTDSGSLLDHIYYNGAVNDALIDVVDTYYSDHDVTCRFHCNLQLAAFLIEHPFCLIPSNFYQIHHLQISIAHTHTNMKVHTPCMQKIDACSYPLQIVFFPMPFSFSLLLTIATLSPIFFFSYLTSLPFQSSPRFT